jgi:hypothetical protein
MFALRCGGEASEDTEDKHQKRDSTEMHRAAPTRVVNDAIVSNKI